MNAKCMITIFFNVYATPHTCTYMLHMEFGFVFTPMPIHWNFGTCKVQPFSMNIEIFDMHVLCVSRCKFLW